MTNELNANLIKGISTILYEKHRDKFVLTDIFDINKPLSLKKEYDDTLNIKVHKLDIGL